VALASDPFAEHVVARLLDFFDRRTQWHRRLWVIGNVLALREVVELHADEAVFPDVRLATRRGLIPNLDGDVGLGSAAERAKLNELLGDKAKLTARSQAVLQLARLADTAERGYLGRWAAALGAGTVTAGPERAARYLAAHLLDMGLSPDHLHRWWLRWARKEPGEYSLAELISKLSEELATGRQQYTVIVFLERFSEFGQSPEGYVPPDEVEACLVQNGFGADAMPAAAEGGAIELQVQALDPGAAVEKVSEMLDAYASRLEVGHKHPGDVRDVFRANGDALVQGVRDPIPLWRRRHVEIHEISRSGLIFAPGGEAIDSALELVSYLDRNAPAAAVAGAWAAVESTLKGPATPHDAARLACSIATASYPRAELTALAKSRSKRNPRDYLAHAIWNATSNRERAFLMADWVRAGLDLEISDASERAALERVRAIISAPGPELRTMRAHMLTTMERLYRQRNLVMHGGRTDAIALRSTLRAAAPIVGASFDRITHALFVEKVEPLVFGAQAELSLDLVQPNESDRLTSLLEQ
jgi:hypothetical protein